MLFDGLFGKRKEIENDSGKFKRQRDVIGGDPVGPVGVGHFCSLPPCICPTGELEVVLCALKG